MKRWKRLGIGARLSLMVVALTVAAVVAVVAVIALRVNSFARQNAVEIALQTASARGNAVKNNLENALGEARSLAKIFEAASVVENAGISRRQANSLLQYFIEHSPEFSSAYVAFEPDAYDGKDANFVEEWGHDSTGRFVPSWTRDEKGEGALAALIGYDTEGAGDYYLAPKKLGRECIIDPRPAPDGGGTLVSLVVPLFNRDRKFLGIAGIDMTLDRIQKMVAEAVLYQTGTLTLYSANGTVSAARDTTILGKKSSAIESDRALQGRLGSSESFVLQRTSARGADILSIGVPFMVGLTQSRWTVVADIPLSEVLGPVRGLVLLIIIMGTVGVLVIGGAVVMIARAIARPLALGASFAKQIAGGNLTTTLDVGRRRDEIGDLAGALNDMTSGLRDMTREIQEGASQLASSSEELSASAQQLADGAQSQASTLEETSAAVEELASSVGQVAQNARSQSTTATETTARMEGVLTSVTNVSTTLEKVATSASGSVERAEAGARSVKEAVEAITIIAQSSEKIVGIVNVISDIADQTNLLALNASIEAARAGEHGRGFAVVADEVSKLAERSAQSTKEIETLIRETLRQVQRGVALAEGSGDSMKAIIGGAMTASQMVVELQKSVELQQEEIRQIAAAVVDLREMSHGISAATEEQTTSSRQVSKAIESVNDITQQAASSAEEMAASTGELARMARRLQGLVARFHLERSSAGIDSSEGPAEPRPSHGQEVKALT
jgi:methyl-accepting chemotaxis protein